MIRRFCLIVVALLIIGLAVWHIDSTRTPESVCSPIHGSKTETLTRGATSVGDVFNRLKSAATNYSRKEVDDAVAHAGLIWKAVWAGFKLAVKVGKVKADHAVTGMIPFKEIDCSAVCATTPPSGPAAPGGPPVDAIPASSARLSGAALAADALRRAGFPGSEIPMGVAVARFESGWRADPGGPVVNGAQMRGMWQINPGAHPDLFAGSPDWRNPYVNARMAYSVWRAAGGSWSPWSTAGTARASLGTAPPPQPAPQAPRPQTGPQQAPQGCVQPSSTAPAPAVIGRVRTVRDVESGRVWRIPIPVGRAGLAVSFALDQAGDPYVWAAHGPNAWDCSGLVSGAWKAAGVSVYPQTEVMWHQEARATGLPQPGDLWGWPGHVQMFLFTDNGRPVVIEAPRPGRRVHIVYEYGSPSRKMRPYGATPTGVAA